jgi:hypothetical protein
LRPTGVVPPSEAPCPARLDLPMSLFPPAGQALNGMTMVSSSTLAAGRAVFLLSRFTSS